jgi:hypothetical protein
MAAAAAAAANIIVVAVVADKKGWTWALPKSGLFLDRLLLITMSG